MSLYCPPRLYVPKTGPPWGFMPLQCPLGPVSPDLHVPIKAHSPSRRFVCPCCCTQCRSSWAISGCPYSATPRVCVSPGPDPALQLFQMSPLMSLPHRRVSRPVPAVPPLVAGSGHGSAAGPGAPPAPAPALRSVSSAPPPPRPRAGTAPAPPGDTGGQCGDTVGTWGNAVGTLGKWTLWGRGTVGTNGHGDIGTVGTRRCHGDRQGH